MADQDRARVLAGAARFRAKRLAKRIKSSARTLTPVQTGTLRRGWRCYRSALGVWVVANVVDYARYMERFYGMLLKACNRHLPAVHVDAQLVRYDMTLILVPWSWQRIMADGNRPFTKGTFIVV